MKMKPIRVLYLGYYIKQLKWPLFFKFLDAVARRKKCSKFTLLADAVSCVFKYNISLLEYFQFHFYDKNKTARDNWAGTGYMYEYQRIMNPLDKRPILDDKTLFHKYYGSYIVHKIYDLEELKNDSSPAEELLKYTKIVLKESRGKCGLGTAFIESKKYTPEGLIRFMEEEGFDLAESYIEQHPDMNRLSPSGVNTVRIITQLNENDEVVLLGCRQRISVDSAVDNLAAGNIAAPIDCNTGKISGPGVYSDITKSSVDKHPVTGTVLEGFRIPFWSECVSLAKNAALAHPQNRSIGWDIVVTKEGPGLIEGNHDWCKLLWQLPVEKGLKKELEKYRNTIKNGK